MQQQEQRPKPRQESVIPGRPWLSLLTILAGMVLLHLLLK